MWLFGYGSLIWKADFKFERKVVGYIKGYVRRFYQSSPDHRGVPEKPGRVVTLLPSGNPQDVVWGVAYKIKDEDCDDVLYGLDYREKCGYDKKTVIFYPGPQESANSRPASAIELVIYVGSPDNEYYAGEAPLKEMAQQIAECEGSSGPNSEYLFNLAKAVRQIAPSEEGEFSFDRHLFDLERAVREILTARKTA